MVKLDGERMKEFLFGIVRIRNLETILSGVCGTWTGTCSAIQACQRGMACVQSNG